MKLFRKLDNFPSHLRGGALTIGNFDGVHRGHARIIRRLAWRAQQIEGPTIVFTFDPHPVRILRPELAPPPLTWTDRKAQLLVELGADVVIAFPTDPQMLQLEYADFFQQVIVRRLGAKAMVEGPNFFFGRDRAGDIQALGELCQSNGIALDIVQPLTEGDAIISSSRIRQLLREGRVDAAAGLLTHPYRIRGMVTHGAGRGMPLGFPTANLDAVDTLVPAMGVYAAQAHIDRRAHWAACHVGPSPTFGDKVAKVEVHVLDFEASIYGQPLEVDFVTRIRDVRQFDSADQLRGQLKLDVEQIRQTAKQYSSASKPA